MEMMVLIPCLASLLTQTKSLDTDARLTARVSVVRGIVSLDDLSQEMSAKTGVPLTVRRRIADRKVTMVFHDRSAREALRMLGTAMRMQWSPKPNGGYELDLTDESAADERRNDSFENSLARKDVERSIAELRRLTAIPAERRLAEADSIRSRRLALLQEGKKRESVDVQFLERSESALHSYGYFDMLGPALARKDLNADVLLSGTPLFAAIQNNGVVPALDSSLIDKLFRGEPLTDAVSVVTLNVGGAIGVNLYAVSSGGTPTTTSGPDWPIIVSDLSSPLETVMASWSRPVSPSVLAATLTPHPEIKGEMQRAYGRADHLIYLAETTGIPVVGDAFRVAFGPPQWFPGKTVGEWLNSFNGKRPLDPRSGPDYIRQEGDWLMFRKAQWWHGLRSEIPERLLRPMSTSREKPPSLDSYAALASNITDAQGIPLRTPAQVLLGFPLGTFGSCVDALRLYGALPPAARAAAASPSGLQLAALNPNAQNIAYRAILAQGMANTGDMWMLRALFPGADRLKGLRFAVEPGPANGEGGDRRIVFNFGLEGHSSHSQLFLSQLDGP